MIDDRVRREEAPQVTLLLLAQAKGGVNHQQPQRERKANKQAKQGRKETHGDCQFASRLLLWMRLQE